MKNEQEGLVMLSTGKERINKMGYENHINILING